VDHVYSGKVRDLYARPDGTLLLVASDRISAFDFILPTPIPDKGRVLTALTMWWFERLVNVVPNHVLSLDVPAEVAGRAMVVERLDMYLVECVARGYLAGSGLIDYDATGSVCGVPLPEGLVDGSRLPEPIFTPATKAPQGSHDENVSLAEIALTIGEDAAGRLKELTLDVYGVAEGIARDRGIVLADTKLEFGQRPDGTIVLADEVLTPDSSRFWPLDLWQPGHAQPSFDKQYVRDWLTSPASGWDRTSGEAPPPLPDVVVERTRARYIEAYERLTGRAFA
jgi:phosphoribosylaminoimidazole-succinocarboxamide synthase